MMFSLSFFVPYHFTLHLSCSLHALMGKRLLVGVVMVLYANSHMVRGLEELSGDVGAVSVPAWWG